MKIEVWVQTRGALSRVTDVVEIDDEDLEDMSDTDKNILIDDRAQDVLPNMYEWGYREIAD